MRKSILSKILLLSSVLFSLDAACLTLNGKNYLRYTGTAKKCPDGSAIVSYLNVSWCRAYGAKLSWAIPVTRVNGTPMPISELTGYEVYWIRSSDMQSGIIAVNQPTQISAILNVSTPGTYFMAVSAINVKGQKSALSTMRSIELGKS